MTVRRLRDERQEDSITPILSARLREDEYWQVERRTEKTVWLRQLVTNTAGEPMLGMIRTDVPLRQCESSKMRACASTRACTRTCTTTSTGPASRRGSYETMPHIRDRFTLPPVGTIYWSPVAERAWKVVKRAEKTLWLQELKVAHSRTASPTISRSTLIGDPIMRRIDNTGHIRPDATTRLHPTKDIVHKPE